jgi:sugar phosphate isomerase/epimerase
MTNTQIHRRPLPGLVSVTFRGLPPREIVDLVRRVRLAGIEWGGDIHVPHGDIGRAIEVGAMTRDAGLAVAAYGSYYHVGESEGEGLEFARVLETAVALGAPLIRVWAGRRGSADADPAYRDRVAAAARRVGAVAAAAGVRVAFEFHSGTLTDSTDSAVELMAATTEAGLLTYWQPPVGWTHADHLDSLARLLPHLAHLHVFHWLHTWERRPLAEGARPWLALLRAAAAAPGGGPRWALLEFVRDDNPAQLAEDAAVLTEWMAQVDREREQS